MKDPVAKFWTDREKAALVIIDVQQRLTPSMDDKVYQQILQNIVMLAKGAETLKLPTLVTEQYPQGLGETVEELQAFTTETAVEKVSFGCCGEPQFLERLQSLGRPQVIVVGMEAHVCVLQTVLGLLQQNFQVHLVRDAICARNKLDYQNALEIAAAAGAVVTTSETVLFQLLRTSTAKEFKNISTLVKQRQA